MEVRIASMQAENVRVAEEERRKTLFEETKHAKAVNGMRTYFSVNEYFSALNTRTSLLESVRKRN